MSAVLQASSYARRLVEGEARQTGSTLTEAIPVVARRMKAPANAVWALLFRPPKRMCADLHVRLEEAVVREVKREIEALQNELAALTGGARRCDPDTLAEVEADIARLRARLRP